MIQRIITGQLARLASQYPVVTVTGPRQSGKTTLCRAAYPEKAYINLESLEHRNQALADPRGFLARFPDGAIVDEIQRAPILLSEIQVLVDEAKVNGRFIVTGSQNFELLTSVSQSLAGRTAILKLLPFSLDELAGLTQTMSQDELLFTGFYPRIYDQGLDPMESAAFYVSTYIERDIRSLINVKDLRSFELFLRLCAGRSAQVVNLSAIAGEVGISHNTVKQWLSVLEASFIIRLVPAYHANINKRLVKSPKLYFLDTGLACFLLGIHKAAQLSGHPLRGALFETFAYAELLKARYNAALPDNISFYRDQHGLEIDFLFDYGSISDCAEVKSSRVAHPDFYKSMTKLRSIIPSLRNTYLMYGGEESYDLSGVRVLGWRRCSEAALARE